MSGSTTSRPIRFKWTAPSAIRTSVNRTRASSARGSSTASTTSGTAAMRGATFDSDSGNYVADRGTFGDARLPLFSQLDARAQYTWTYTLWQFTLYLDVQNVLNQKNEEIHVYDYRYQQQGSITGLP